MPNSKTCDTLSRGNEILALSMLKKSRSKMDAEEFLDDVAEVMSVSNPNAVIDAVYSVLGASEPVGANLAKVDNPTMAASPSKEIH